MKEEKRYTHLTKEERSEIEILLNKEYSIRSIAKVLDRDPGTISREVKRNGLRTHRGNRKGVSTGRYRAKLAQQKAGVRRNNAKYQGKKIWENKELREYIKKKLKQDWSPDVISGRIKIEEKSFYASKTAIYEYLYSSYGQSLCKYLPSKRYRKKRREKKKKKERIPNRVSIEKRPKEANLKLRYGHYEGDTIVSGRKTGSKTSLSVLYERKAKYIAAKKVSCLKPKENNEAIEDMGRRIEEFRTLTLDNGIENMRHRELKEEMGIETFFCDPYSSWQKGGVENANRLIRRYIPKGEDINNYSDEFVKDMCDKLNNIPRKSLGYKTPMEVMLENGLLREERETKTPLRSGVGITRLSRSNLARCCT